VPPKLAFQARVVRPSMAACNTFAFLAGGQYFAKCDKCQPLRAIVLHRR